MTDQTDEVVVNLPAGARQALLVHCELTGRRPDEVIGGLLRDHLQGTGGRTSFEAALARVRTEYRAALDELAK